MSTDTSPANHLRRILVGLDGSRGGARALEWATARIIESGSELLAVHVLTYNQQFGRDLSPTGLTNWRRKLQSDLAGHWPEPARAARAGVRTVLVEGDSAAAGLPSTHRSTRFRRRVPRFPSGEPRQQ